MQRLSDTQKLKVLQKNYFNQKDFSEFEITRPHGSGKLYEFLLCFKIKFMARMVGQSLVGSNLLNVCCGSGLEAEYFAKLGSKVIALDISTVALQRTRERTERFRFPLRITAADAEILPFKSESFDFVFVHDGLHHLPEPAKAITEMARVARKGIFFTEPADAFITRIAVKLGLTKDYGEAGHFIYRFAPRRLRRLFSEIGLSHSYFKRYGMWYKHHPPKWFQLFENKFLFSLFKVFFYLGNSIFGRFGNKLVTVAWKDNKARQNLITQKGEVEIKKTLVIGVGGFIGSRLARELYRQGHSVRVVDVE